MQAVKNQIQQHKIHTRYKPREKLKKLGINNLTTVELISLILGSGTQKTPVFSLANCLIKKFPGKKLSTTDTKHLMTIKGIGFAQASRLIACVELGKRLGEINDHLSVNNPKSVYQLTQDIKDKKKEHAVALYLNGRQQLIKKQLLTVGSSNFNHLEVRDLFTPALTLPAAFIILVHNHPSGDPNPSNDDILVTNRLVEAGNILGIEFIDHVIVTNNNYFSFKERRLLNTID